MTATHGRLQLRITLEQVEPKIWRQVVVRDTLTFGQLHEVIQRAMGWEDCHLHEFEVGEVRVGPRDGEGSFGDEREVMPEGRLKLAELLGHRRKFRYGYDFGDDWWHEIVIERRLPADAQAPAADLLAGERACPPEDCGGPWRYHDLLESLADPRHPEHDEVLEWVGAFDPEAFDLEAARRLVRTAVRTRRGAAK